jgi:hypothetical protein
MTNYGAGTLVFAFHWNGYMEPAGKQWVTRRSVVRPTGLKEIELDEPIGEQCDRLKWVNGVPIAPPSEGDSVVKLEDSNDLERYAVGMPVMVTDGPTLANEARGEFRTIEGIEHDPSTIRLDRPLRSSYAAAALVRIKPVRNITLRNFAIKAPKDPLHYGGNFKCCMDWHIEGVSSQSTFGFCSSADIRMTNCGPFESFGANTTHNLTVIGSKCNALYFEEGCSDVEFVDCQIGPSPTNGICTIVGCERFRFQRVRIHGSSIMPIAVGGRENVFESVTVEQSKREECFCYIAGDRARVDGLTSDVGVVFKDGIDQSARQVKAPMVWFGWDDGKRSSGTAREIHSPKIDVKSKEWKVNR